MAKDFRDRQCIHKVNLEYECSQEQKSCRILTGYMSVIEYFFIQHIFMFKIVLLQNVKVFQFFCLLQGFDVKDQLLKICFYTTDKDIRDFLVGKGEAM